MRLNIEMLCEMEFFFVCETEIVELCDPPPHYRHI